MDVEKHLREPIEFFSEGMDPNATETRPTWVPAADELCLMDEMRASPVYGPAGESVAITWKCLLAPDTAAADGMAARVDGRTYRVLAVERFKLRGIPVAAQALLAGMSAQEAAEVPE